jgi:RND family efflux transporter MFP subunit
VLLMAAAWLHAAAGAPAAHDHPGHGQADVAGDHAGHDHAHEDGQGLWAYDERLEGYAEPPVLVRGRPVPLLLHLTRLSDHRPLAGAMVRLRLLGGGTEEVFPGQELPVPGLYRVDLAPARPGQRKLWLEVEGEIPARLDMGVLPVWAEPPPAGDHEAPAGIRFTKEQQWATDFGVASVTRRVLRPAVSAIGTLRAAPDGEAVVHAPSTGHLFPAEGGFPGIGMSVRRGQVLARLVPHLGGDMDLTSLELELNKARVAHARARRELERAEDLVAQQLVPARRLRDARLDEELARAELGAAEARLDHYRRVPLAADAHHGLPIQAPIDGTIAEVRVTAGAFLREGDLLLHVVDARRLRLEVRVPEAAVGRLARPSGVWFRVEGFDRGFDLRAGDNAELVAYGGVVDPASRTVPLVMAFASPDPALHIGMSAQVQVFGGEGRETPAVPATAVLDEGGQSVVYVQTGGETFARRVVQTGLHDGDWVAVVQGLEPGERVVAHGAYLVRLASAQTGAASHGHEH